MAPVRRLRRFGIGAVAGALAATTVLATPAFAATRSPAVDADTSVVVGAFGFTESRVLAETYAGALRAAGIPASVRVSSSRERLAPLLLAGTVDVVPEYLGSFTEYLNRRANGAQAPARATTSVQTTLRAARSLATPVGVTVLRPSSAEDVNAFAVSRPFADAHGVRTLSDLAAWSTANPLRLGGPDECPVRPFCQPGLERVYGMQFSEFVPLDAGGPLTRSALVDGSIDVGLVFSTDAGVAEEGLVVLTDDRRLQTVDSIVPAISTKAATPRITRVLDRVSGAMTTQRLTELNRQVEFERRTPRAVARDFLRSVGLLPRR